MDHRDRTHPHGLRLIRGGKDRQDPERGSLRIVVAPVDRPPFSVDSMVIEDDTYFVLGASPEVRQPTESPLRLWNEVHETEPAEPGDVIVRPGLPRRLSAVVHDLSRDPTWTEKWIADALGRSLCLADEMASRSLGLQPLGAVHGRLPLERFLILLRHALDQARPRTLARIWLIGDPERVDLSALPDGEGPD